MNILHILSDISEQLTVMSLVNLMRHCRMMKSIPEQRWSEKQVLKNTVNQR